MKHTFFKVFILFLFVFFWSDSKAQVGFHTLGFEGQIYPTGYLLGLRGEFALAEKHSIDLRVGTNIFDHQDFGVQDEEVGDGFGFTLGYRYYFSKEKEKWIAGIRSDLWWNTVEWKNNTVIDDLEGTTEIFVVQPTAIVGYVWKLGEHFQITPTIAFGFEVNAITDGAPTGEGAILLGGINLDYQF